jgi:DNA-binding transcriptional ArsR family regulator
MLEGLFGNATAEKVLFFVALNRQGYAQEISTRLGVPLTSVQNQLRRLERGGVLVALVRGRMRLYELNPRYAVGAELEALLRRAFDLLPARERERYLVRRRPRGAGKPL